MTQGIKRPAIKNRTPRGSRGIQNLDPRNGLNSNGKQWGGDIRQHLDGFKKTIKQQKGRRNGVNPKDQTLQGPEPPTQIPPKKPLGVFQQKGGDAYGQGKEQGRSTIERSSSFKYQETNSRALPKVLKGGPSVQISQKTGKTLIQQPVSSFFTPTPNCPRKKSKKKQQRE